MNKNEFVIKLKDLTPSEESFARLGYSSELIKKEVLSYECKPRSPRLFSLNANSEVLNLLNFYDCSSVQVGIVNFTNNIKETADFIIIGEVEADILALNKVTLEIQVLDHLDLNWVIWSCAANGNKFLDALLASAEFFSRRINNTELAYKTSFTYEYVLLCTEKAGGEKYKNFYEVLLGYDG